MCRFVCRSLILAAFALALMAALSPPTMAQVCNGTNVVTPLGSLTDKVPGPPSAQSVALLRYTFGNDVTSDCDSDTDNGGIEQVVTQVIIRPSCNISGGACLPDPGGDDGDPNTPAIAFLSLDATTCTGGLGNITVDTSDPYAVALNFTTPLVFAPNTSCSVDITLHVRERGNATTPNTVAQQYGTDGTCQCDPELTAGGNASSQLFLTCPPCSTNFCAPEHCDAATVQCVADPLPDCFNVDNDLCTPGSCDPAANGGTGACVNGPRTVCGNEDSFCNPGHCAAETGTCVLDPEPDCSNADNDLCTPGFCNEQLRICDNGAENSLREHRQRPLYAGVVQCGDRGLRDGAPDRVRERRQLLQSRSLRGGNRDLRAGPGAGLLESRQRSVHAGALRPHGQWRHRRVRERTSARVREHRQRPLYAGVVQSGDRDL